MSVEMYVIKIKELYNLENHSPTEYSELTRLKRIKSDIVEKPLKLVLIEKPTYLYNR